jgi:hypothetical protein
MAAHSTRFSDSALCPKALPFTGPYEHDPIFRLRFEHEHAASQLSRARLPVRICRSVAGPYALLPHSEADGCPEFWGGPGLPESSKRRDTWPGQRKIATSGLFWAIAGGISGCSSAYSPAHEHGLGEGLTWLKDWATLAKRKIPAQRQHEQRPTCA